MLQSWYSTVICQMVRCEVLLMPRGRCTGSRGTAPYVRMLCLATMLMALGQDGVSAQDLFLRTQDKVGTDACLHQHEERASTFSDR